MNQDYYSILGVEKGATKDEIKKAYRKLVKQWHPDVNKASEAEAKFKEIQTAYDVLSDNNKRSQYDQFGQSGVGDGMNFSGGYYDMGEFGGMGDIFDQLLRGAGMSFGANSFATNSSDFGFSDLFGTSRRPRQRHFQGEDIKVQITLDIIEANEGTEKNVKFDFKGICEKCAGTGAKDKKFKTCTNCNGSGYIQSVQDSFFGRMIMKQPCDSCGGHGTIPADICSECNGKGYVPKTEDIQIKVPVGTYDGLLLRFRGDNRGDLYVQVRVKPHDVFKRKGNDIYMGAEVPIKIAVLGGTVEIPTLYGNVKLKVPKATQPMDIIKIKNYGTYAVGNRERKGDLYVTAIVKVPTRLTAEQKKRWEMID